MLVFLRHIIIKREWKNNALLIKVAKQLTEGTCLIFYFQFTFKSCPAFAGTKSDACTKTQIAMKTTNIQNLLYLLAVIFSRIHLHALFQNKGLKSICVYNYIHPALISSHSEQGRFIHLVQGLVYHAPSWQQPFQGNDFKIIIWRPILTSLIVPA